MAIKLPARFQLDSSSFPKDKWAQDLVSSLNKYVLQIQAALMSIPEVKFKDVTLNTGSDPSNAFPIVIEVGVKPQALWIGSIIGGSLYTAEPVTVLWDMTANGSVRINNITGLVPNAQDTIRLVWI